MSRPPESFGSSAAGDGPSSSSCAAVDDELVELALGILEGRRRAEIVAHVDRCRRCARTLEEHALALEGLLRAAPLVEPPLGFEARVAERFHELRRRGQGGEQRPGAGRRRLAALVAAAALGGAAAGAAIVAGLSKPTVRTPSYAPLAVALTADGVWRGAVVVTPGRPGWLSVAVQDGHWAGWVTCQVTTTSGKVLDAGRFDLSSGYGAWTVPLAVAPDDVRDARVVSGDGTLIGEGVLRR
jgi:hypothetical protein